MRNKTLKKGAADRPLLVVLGRCVLWVMLILGSVAEIQGARGEEAFHGVEEGTVFQAYGAGVAGFFDGGEYNVVVVFAKLQLVSAGVTCGVEVGDTIEVVCDIGDDVALHDLLVVDVKNHFDLRVIDLADDVKGLGR